MIHVYPLQLVGDAQEAVPTVSIASATCVTLSLVPVMVRMYVPAAVELLVETDKVEEPEPPLIDDGLNDPLAPEGNPLILRLTAPAKLFCDATEISYSVFHPAAMLCCEGLPLTVKYGVAGFA
jgi:hypothetical protein